MIPPLRRIQLFTQNGRPEVRWVAPGRETAGRFHAVVPGPGLVEWLAMDPDRHGSFTFFRHIYNKLRRTDRAAGARCAAAKLCNHMGERR
jgi:hypothetical protein